MQKTRGLIPALSVCTIPRSECQPDQPLSFRIVKYKIKNADASGSEFINTNLQGSRFHDVNLSSAEFVDVNLSNTNFEDVALTNVTIRNANCSHMVLEDACYEGMLIDGIPVTELLRVYQNQQA
ncbi:hypothetical protein BGE01nite_02520 [Brevifollis gellanilyticus]|uniref:Pentapeptide repeat-containing protein n=1 Tax=Brevifollis gellanilyticus TaxID=748831 RepID=A0A512M3R5_9BACT|nr:hypothetical protein BGE01nite_02520 [Brevifollis gellanilyticus]